MKLKLSFSILLLFALISNGVCQCSEKSRLTVGIEQDLLPYVTGGYYAAAWIGKGHFRGRALPARVKKPDLIVPEGFDDNWVTAYAVLGEYFLKEDWQGWSVSTGFVYWQNSIELEGGSRREDYDTYLINGSLSYSFKIYRHFYVSPWAGLHLKVGGPDTITIDGQSFDQPLINPEASIKFGVYF
jgi:hypothetical protein